MVMSCVILHYLIYTFYRFICKNNGVLFESELIQVGVKCEFKRNLGRLGLFYGNKTTIPLQVSFHNY